MRATMRMKTYLPFTFSALLLASPLLWSQEAGQPQQANGPDAVATAPSTTAGTVPARPASGMEPGMMQGGPTTTGPGMTQGGTGTMGAGMMQGGTGTMGPGMMDGRGTGADTSRY